MSEKHKIYIEECGNPNGEPIIYLHGGPGGGCGKKARRFFDPEYYYIILFDQRGCGRSKPFLELEENTILELIEDIEKIRKHIGIEKFNIFSGSFGSALAVLYAIKYKERVKTLILQGIFLGREEDISWFFEEGLSEIYPDEFEKFSFPTKYIKDFKNLSPFKQYIEVLLSTEDINLRNKVAKAWSNYELKVTETGIEVSDKIEKHDISIAVLQAHYFKNRLNWLEENYILKNAHKIADIPCYMAHGRFDFNARLGGAYELIKILKNCKFEIVEGVGHSPFTKKMSEILIGFTEEIKRKNKD